MRVFISAPKEQRLALLDTLTKVQTDFFGEIFSNILKFEANIHFLKFADSSMNWKKRKANILLHKNLVIRYIVKYQNFILSRGGQESSSESSSESSENDAEVCASTEG